MSLRPFLAVLAALSAVSIAWAQPARSLPPTLQRLHDALHLTADQQAAWKGFTAQAGPDPEAEAQARAAEQMMPKLHAPQRVDLSVAAMRAQLEAMERRGKALKAFYAALTPAQQAIFDRETLPREDEGGRF